jgi:hypothetical protein
MLVSLADIPGSPFLPHIHVSLETLISHIVTCGFHQFLVFPTTSIISLFLMIVRTNFELFHFTLNLTPFSLCQICSLMSKPSLAAPSGVFSMKTGVNLTIPLPAPFSQPWHHHVSFMPPYFSPEWVG